MHVGFGSVFHRAGQVQNSGPVKTSILNILPLREHIEREDYGNKVSK